MRGFDEGRKEWMGGNLVSGYRVEVPDGSQCLVNGSRPYLFFLASGDEVGDVEGKGKTFVE